jgi:4'-phosphopantetheinyl transferase
MTEPTSEIPRTPVLLEWQPGAVISRLSPGEIRVWIVDLDSGIERPEQVDSAEPGPELVLLDDYERARAARFLRARDRRRFVRCRAALREILGGLLGEPPRSMRFRARAQGKPELDHPPRASDQSGGQAELRFNVSHSAELALVAAHLGRELGVDLERVRSISEADSIVSSYFSPVEHGEFAALADDAKSLAFLSGWTRKEAILKGLGIGLAGLATRYETGFATTLLTPRFLPAVPPPRVENWQLWEAAPRADFVAAVAAQLS